MVDCIKFQIEKKIRRYFSNNKENSNQNLSFIESKILKKSKKQRNRNNIKSLNKIIRNSALFNITSSIIVFIAFISMLSIISSSETFELRKLSTNNFIILSIQGNGIQSIINEDFSPLPQSIQINEIEVPAENINAQQELTSETNTIKLLWTTQLDSCQNMFRNLENITMVDLTNFDFSLIMNMAYFFEGCTSLKSVDLSNINAPEVIFMSFMFKNCISLESVN